MAAYLSWRAQRKSKAERVEAKEQADRAERAANAAERQADAVVAQEQRQVEATEDAEADPWELEPIPGYDNCYLINTTETAKYDIMVDGFKIHDGPAQFDMIGPGKREELSIMRIQHPDDSVDVTWHRRRDLSAAPQTRRKTIPSRI
jgi:hypothetical protein